MKVKMRKWYSFLIALFAVMMLFTPITCKAEEKTTFDSVEEAKEYISQQEDIAGSAGDNIAGAEQYIKEKTVPMYATIWALVPPIIAIGLALITKEVYFSLFVGILTGALFYSNFNLEKTISTVFVSGVISKLSDVDNVGILIFLVVLGIMVSLMNKVGGSAAYGKWAGQKITTRRGAMLATFGLGALIFVDDYFNCLTVGSVMRPVTDKYKISRARLAYIIDATAAPICIIAPISSWAAAVSGVVEGNDGFTLFLRSIPYNFYALLTIVMVVTMAIMQFDFGPMRKHEENALKGDLFTTGNRPFEDGEVVTNGKGKVIDLILPVLVLIVCCVLGMVYTGGFFHGEAGFMEAFANCDASLSLVYGSFLALVVTFFFYIVRRVLSLKEFAESFTDGFKAMVPAILILIFAWTLSGITRMLGADVFVANIVQNSAGALQLFLPAIIFAISVGLAFATGTSWGTFGILLPIVVAILEPGSEMLIISISACLAGAVCGDHVSPISDTTIMSSAGAQCDHMNHVTTQLPYALIVAAVSLVAYIIAAFIQNVWISLPIAIALMLIVLFVMNAKYGKDSGIQ
ncbi:Na+/H+ antiporter NhaC [Lachnoclostridium phytofermentans ISDg]|uniref:Na+/H+ antiporter NhaC n=2 Tax=Lachnoclostridium phytofermentans TaxID=66219 RepID=A9KMK1_LACP7|nr:Na+/H+ antiporter NhaC family protein [Lachnoclostridium phytofermentans]ABX41446.1 Na+/H+ antiporter NhaC [Lachnoclostridium phytofermentans ISDg]